METLYVNFTPETRQEIVQPEVNRIIDTDTYNRTMDYLRGPEGWKETETYVLQMRRSPYGYLVAAGVEDMVEQLTAQPITQAELDEADKFAAENNVPFFNHDMWQTIIDDYDGKLPIEIHGAKDGTVVLPGEPMVRVTGPGELIAHFEHLFHRPFYDTLVATKANEITQLLGDPNRFIEVGKRGALDEQVHLRALKAMQIGGDITQTSNDFGVFVDGDLRSVGTIGHRYIQRFPSVEAAFRHAIENLDTVSLLVDLVDSVQGIDTALELKQEYRDTGKNIWVRLDSGDLKSQVRYYLDRCAELGFTDPVKDRITVEGFEDLDEVREIEAILTEDEKKRVAYGAGGMLISEHTSRSDASTGFKLAEYITPVGETVVTRKFSDTPGKGSIPGEPTVVLDGLQRVIAQRGELPDAQDLLQPLYRFGTTMRASTTAEAQTRRREQYPRILELVKNQETATVSPKTTRLIGEVCLRYNLPTAA